MKMFTKRIAKNEEELCEAKKDNERRCQMLDAVGKMRPNIVHGADLSEDLDSQQQEPESTHIKVEDEKHPYIKGEEDLELDCIKAEDEQQQPPLLKEKQDKDPKVEKPERDCIKEQKQPHDINLPSTFVSLQREDEGQIEGNRGAEPPRSSSCQHMTMEDRGDKQSEGGTACHSDNKRWKCSQCENAYSYKNHLKRHENTHWRETFCLLSLRSKILSERKLITTHKYTHR
ncbi:uncharacterized protein LOC144035316 isoform X1 [Vanacampus margaritifer]